MLGVRYGFARGGWYQPASAPGSTAAAATTVPAKASVLAPLTEWLISESARTASAVSDSSSAAAAS